MRQLLDVWKTAWSRRGQSSDQRRAIDRADLTFDLLNKQRLHQAVAPLLEPMIPGFSTIEPLFYARAADESVLHLIHLQKIKGGSLVPIFGLAVATVPAIRSGKIRFRKRPRKFEFDILFNLADSFVTIDHTHGIDCAVEDAREVLPLYIAEAERFWSAHRRPGEMASAVRAMEQHLSCSDGLQYENYVQPRIARPFLLALGGAKRDAQQRWVELQETMRSELSAVEWEKLQRAFSEASGSGG